MGTASPTIQAVYSACLGVIPHALIVIVGTVSAEPVPASALVAGLGTEFSFGSSVGYSVTSGTGSDQCPQ